MRRALPVALLLAVAAWPAVARADSCAAPSSWVAGSTSLCSGAIVYNDYVDDDYGADTGNSNTTSRTAGLAPTAAMGNGDISQFGYDVNVADLRSGVTRTPPPVTGFHERVYTSKYTVPPQNEGVDVSGVPGRGNGGGAGVPLGFEQTFQYLGHYQPYGIYIPKKPGPHGMQMVFHGSSSVFTGLINAPGMQQKFGEGLNRVLVVPEARGQNGFG